MTHYIYTKQRGFNEVIEATMEKPGNITQDYDEDCICKECNHETLLWHAYNNHLSTARSYPIEGEIPDNWKDGDEVKVRLQHQCKWLAGKWYNISEEDYIEELNRKKRIVAIPIPLKPKNCHEALEWAKATPTYCIKCNAKLTGYTAIGMTNSEITRVCNCGQHNTLRWWGTGSEWINTPISRKILDCGNESCEATYDKCYEEGCQNPIYENNSTPVVGLKIGNPLHEEFNAVESEEENKYLVNDKYYCKHYPTVPCPLNNLECRAPQCLINVEPSPATNKETEDELWREIRLSSSTTEAKFTEWAKSNFILTRKLNTNE